MRVDEHESEEAAVLAQTLGELMRAWITEFRRIAAASAATVDKYNGPKPRRGS